MGAGTSATHMIFFIAAIVIAIGVVGVVTVNVQSLSSSTNIGSKALSNQLKTDITLINDPLIIPFDGTNYTFYVKNTGATELTPSSVNILLDGSMNTIDTWRILDRDGNTWESQAAVWKPGDVLEINLTQSLPAGDHYLKVACENGESDSMKFKI